MELLECKHLCKSYGCKSVLKDINLTIPRGKIVGLLGRNGQGKTTLIKLMNDLLTPTSGEVLVNGKHIGVESKKIISYLPERTYLDKTMTLNDVVKYFKEFYDTGVTVLAGTDIRRRFSSISVPVMPPRRNPPARRATKNTSTCRWSSPARS